ncbi:penicillin acylase family protein [Lignipirellula cremea]|uniref:Acyl-homoserine lactone acylase QuiP n=1 Tax=Lignipirellula cremea TaxID=2528010 RepID=A0A518DLS3_9BACT|nr:penicillin acylase family protein [Lignipirellula cremea]QDU92775.1 Acyl-homoserine lactone acylase QuiP precursor [Lignipirellula cremea]
MKPLRLKNCQRDIQASRDAAGVPHLQAANWLDAVYGLGFLHAIDRGTQMLFSRSVAQGTAAADISGSSELLETDHFFRRLGLGRLGESEAEALSENTREQLQAYCQGVNDGIAGVGRTLPIWATGFQITPWQPSSVLLVGQLLSFGGLAVSQMQNERLLIDLIHAGASEEGLKELFTPHLDDVDFELLRQVKMASQLSDDALEVLIDLPRLAGSNAWAVRPQRSASGGAMLASDPHLEINRLPAIWYEAVVRYGDRYVMGATLPGCPLFAVARTERLAWGVTYMKGDTVDFFVEDCRRTDDGVWQYRREQEWEDFTVREEIIQRKGGASETLLAYENPQGVLDSNPDERGPGYHLSIAWTGNNAGSGAAIASWLDVLSAEDAAAGMEIVRECTQPTLCWVFADREGHIGLQSCGRFPIRGGGHTGLTPIPAWDPANHWQGFHPTSILPRIYDPPEGFVATANENINPPGGPMFCTQILPGYRKRRIDERLQQLDHATLNDMQSLQYDLISLQASDLVALFLPHLPEGKLKERLSGWNFSFHPTSQEAPLFQSLYRNVLVEIFGHEEGIGWRRMVYLCSRAGFSGMVVAAIDRLLHQEKSCWWRVRDKGSMIHDAALRVDADAKITWADVNYFHFTDRYFGSHQVGRLFGFNSRQYPMPGHHATPFQGHVLQTAKRESTFAPSYHFVTDLSTDWAATNMPGGPSESRFSRYYNIDVPRWFSGEYKKLHGQPEPDSPPA